MSLRLTIRRAAVAAIVGSLLLAACSAGAGDDPPAGDPPASGTGLNVAVASFDLAVEDDARFMTGLFTNDRSLILGGEVEMSFFHLTTGTGTQAEPVARTTGRFLPVPGKEPRGGLEAPTVTSPADGAGVYETRVDLDRPGLWGVQVQAETATGERLVGTASFQVAEEHAVPAVGEPAIPVANHTVGADVPPVAIDSRAQGDDAEVPDPQLHDTTVASALEAGRPIVLVVSTPTYCVSQFCGPITETIAELADTYGERAEFIHLEVWEDFEQQQLADAAAEWIVTDAGGNEPWVFLIGADGTIQARWDNVLDEADLVEELETLSG